jgi:hypothetical protein
VSLARLLSGDTVSVRTYLGQGAYGPSYDEPRDVDCRAHYERKMARDAGGNEILSELTIYAPPTLPDGARTVDVFAVGSAITYEGRESWVIEAATHRGMGPPVLAEIAST